MLGFVLGTIGRRVLEKAFENSVRAIEVRSNKTVDLNGSSGSNATWTPMRR